MTVPQPPYPVDGNGSFSNYQLAAIVVLSPWLLFKLVPFLSISLFGWAHILLLPVIGIPAAVGYWALMSRVGGPKRDFSLKTLPNKPMDYYFTFKDEKLRKEYSTKKIPMQTLYDAYFDQKVDFNHDILETMEARHDWATFAMTWELFYDVFTRFLPDVIMHTSSQDQEQIRDHYDRGNDFYSWFLGPRMIYTSGVVSDSDTMETLEELQDNKLALVCHKLDLQPEDRLLDIGCGWGTLATYAAKNFGCDATGVTLAREQTKFGTQRIADNGWVHLVGCSRIDPFTDARLNAASPPTRLAFSAWTPTIFPTTRRAGTQRSSRWSRPSTSVSDDISRSCASSTTSSTTTASLSCRSPVCGRPGSTRISSGDSL